MPDRELKVKILGDARGVQDAARQTEQSFARFGPAGAKANSALGKVQGHLDGFGPLGKKAGGAIDKIAGGLGNIPLPAAAAAAGFAAAGAALVKFTTDGISKFTALAQEVRNFQRTSGATAEVSSKFVAVLDDLGISSETGAAAISKLTRNVSAGKLKEFNIELGHTADGGVNTTETLLNVADAYAATADPAERARLRFAAFGKQGDALIPILEKGRAGLQQFFDGVSETQILSQEDLDKAESFRLAMDRLGDAVDDLQREAGAAAAGPVTVLANVLAAVAEKAGDAERASGGWIENFRKGLGHLPVVGDFARDVGIAGTNTKTLAGVSREAAGAMQQVVEAAEDEAKALDDLANATLASFNASIAYERSLNNLEDAQADVTENQKAYNDAVKAHGTNSAEAKAANEDLSRSQLDLREAALQVAAAAAKQAEEQAKANGQQWNAAKDGIPAQIAALSKLRDTLAPGNPLRANLDAYITQLEALAGEHVADVQIRIRTQGTSDALAAFASTFKPGTFVPALGAADGAIVSFAGGGEHHVAQIAKAGDWRVWAEPETGGEAYIPLAPSKRARSTAIWRETGRKLGVKSYADGGVAGGNARGTVVINIGHVIGDVSTFRAELARELERNGIDVLSYK